MLDKHVLAPSSQEETAPSTTAGSHLVHVLPETDLRGYPTSKSSCLAQDSLQTPVTIVGSVVDDSQLSSGISPVQYTPSSAISQTESGRPIKRARMTTM